MKRLTLDLAPEVVARLEAVAAETRAGDIIEVVRRALAVYSYLQDEMSMAGEVFVRRADGTEVKVEVR